MQRLGWSWVVLLSIRCATTSARAEDGAFEGEWRTSIGIVKLHQERESVTGTFGDDGQFSIKGNVEEGKGLIFEYQEGKAEGDGRFTLDETGRAFSGEFRIRGGRGGPWNGWRPDPEAPEAPRGQFAGLWLTTLGLLDLGQDGDRARGRYALRGTSEIEGDVVGRRLEFRYRGFRGGRGWFDLAEDGSTLEGAAHGDGSTAWYGWRGRPAPEFARHIELAAGKVVDGSTRGLLTYSVRAPEAYREGETTWPVVVILHGSNMNGRGYVETIAAAWPEIARDFILLGLNGETPSSLGPDPRFNYSYVNYVGRSTLRGFPGTDRESPALVAEALAELKGVYPVARYLVGGHSQGGFLTYSLLMNSPELIAGAFPVSSGVIVQCEPGAYADEALKRGQRRVPLAIVHGETDPVVDFGSARYAAELFGEAGWPAFRFFVSESGGHMFARLPVDEAIRWLDAGSSEDPARLLDYAGKRLEEGAFRDAVAAINRARDSKPNAALAGRIEVLARAIDVRAEPGAKEFLAKIRAGEPGWIDGFLAYRDDFEFADASREVMAAFGALRARHEAPARVAFIEARRAFQQGRQADGYSKYREIVEEHYASPLYRTVKRWLSERR